MLRYSTSRFSVLSYAMLCYVMSYHAMVFYVNVNVVSLPIISCCVIVSVAWSSAWNNNNCFDRFRKGISLGKFGAVNLGKLDPPSCPWRWAWDGEKHEKKDARGG